MSGDRAIVVLGHIVWVALVMWPATVPTGTFPNSIEPRIFGMPWVYFWFCILSAAWFLMLPAILRDSSRPRGFGDQA